MELYDFHVIERSKGDTPSRIHARTCDNKLCPFLMQQGSPSGAVVEALRYKPEGRGIDSRWCHWNFSLT
jgi:hypothetical protein